MAKVLIVEDSRVQASLLARALLESGPPIDAILAHDGREGLEMVVSRRPDLIVLDLGLPFKDGLDVLREIRAGKATRTLPVVLVTAKVSVEDQLVGFALGADDYVVKPYDIRVLVARIESILKRVRREPPGDGVIFDRGGLVVDCYRHRAIVEGKPVPLTPTEFSLLEVLVRHPGRVFTRSELMDAIGGADVAILEGTINVYIGNLRQKLGGAGPLIETVRGVGYRLREPQSG